MFLINLIIKDGLGNQLFQYAYTRYLQQIYSDGVEVEPIVINPYYIDRYDFRKVSLQHFKLNPNVTFLAPEHQKKNMNTFKIRVLLANGLDIIPWKIFKKKPLGEEKFIKRAKQGVYYTYRSQTEFKTYLSNASDKYVFGCFQGETNFLPVANCIKDELEIITTPSRDNCEMLKRIKSTNAVCLHIRRGDYLDARWKNLQICDFDYYNTAINDLLQRVSNPIFYVFSNCHEDLEWIRENYRFVNKVSDEKLNFVYVDLCNPDYEELRLMMNCKHFIISNSTFSWWAAYLSSNVGKIVMVPERWNLSLDNDDSIYLDSWVKVYRNSQE